MKDRLNFIISVFEQLSLNGFKAYAPLEKGTNRIADIALDGNIIAYFTKDENIEKHPYAEVKEATIDKLNDILRKTKTICNFLDEQNFFSDSELSLLYISLVKVRMMTDSDLTVKETQILDRLIEKIESMVSRLGEMALDNSHDNELDAEMEGEEL